jgi:hypothetical protein
VLLLYFRMGSYGFPRDVRLRHIPVFTGERPRMSLNVYMPDSAPTQSPLVLPIGAEYLALTADDFRQALEQTSMVIMRRADGGWYIARPRRAVRARGRGWQSGVAGEYPRPRDRRGHRGPG